MQEIKIGTVFIRNDKLEIDREEGIEIKTLAENVKVINISNKDGTKDQYFLVGCQLVYKLSSDSLR